MVSHLLTCDYYRELCFHSPTIRFTWMAFNFKSNYTLRCPSDKAIQSNLESNFEKSTFLASTISCSIDDYLRNVLGLFISTHMTSASTRAGILIGCRSPPKGATFVAIRVSNLFMWLQLCLVAGRTFGRLKRGPWKSQHR